MGKERTIALSAPALPDFSVAFKAVSSLENRISSSHLKHGKTEKIKRKVVCGDYDEKLRKVRNAPLPPMRKTHNRICALPQVNKSRSIEEGLQS